VAVDPPTFLMGKQPSRMSEVGGCHLLRLSG